MAEKLFKSTTNLKTIEQYIAFVDDDLKSLGFNEKSDEVFYRTKAYLFLSLYHLVKDSGPSFDTEIYFNSLIDDLKDTFDAVGPSLLQLQRDRLEPQEPAVHTPITEEQQGYLDELFSAGKS